MHRLIGLLLLGVLLTAETTAPQTVLRRLNRREYLNTVGDLFGINMMMFDPGAKFPRDQIVDHMDNIGEALRTSGYLLEQYLEAADQVVEKAFRVPQRPEKKTWAFSSNFRQQPELDYAHKQVFGQKYMVLYSTTKTVNEEGAYGPLYAFAEGVPVDGYYDVKVRAEAVNRQHPYDPAMFGMDPAAPFRLGIVPGNAKVGALHHAQPIEPRQGEVTLGDNGPETHTFRVWLDAGYSPRFTFPNGINDSRRSVMAVLRKYQKQFPADVLASMPKVGIYPARPVVFQYGKLPQIRIHEVKIEGPLIEQWPPPSQKLILGDKPFEPGRTRELLERFATRAYRRPVRPDELNALMSVVERRTAQGKAPFDAFKDGLKATLCSPAFLYLDETAGPDQKLFGYALATRLSYFLWATMPDPELFRLAGTGELTSPDVLLKQTRRMLADPKSNAFVEGFLNSWLNLRSLGDMPPDRDVFSRYYSDDLQTAMLTETRMFTRHLLDANQSIVNFLDSQFTFVNKPLARLYGMDSGMPSVGGELFRKVAVTDARRGGLLGQGSVLTVSANGIETSPVTRGVWMLENIFGTPPSPPPPNVPAIDPDVRGAKTIREVLAKHRESAACMACHARIDPPGFALENFDPIGNWRSKYHNKTAIDASGQLGAGRTFDDVVGLKKLLVANKNGFARVLAERLLTYGCGRRIERDERPRVENIVGELEKRGYGFRDLIELAVVSDIFRRK